MIVMKRLVDMSHVVLAHQGAQTVCVPFWQEPDFIYLKAKVVRIVDLNVPTVALLTKDSTPQRQVVDNGAYDSFIAAVKELLETGRSFYTVLRPDWNLPAALWEKS